MPKSGRKNSGIDNSKAKKRAANERDLTIMVISLIGKHLTIDVCLILGYYDSILSMV